LRGGASTTPAAPGVTCLRRARAPDQGRSPDPQARPPRPAPGRRTKAGSRVGDIAEPSRIEAHMAASQGVAPRTGVGAGATGQSGRRRHRVAPTARGAAMTSPTGMHDAEPAACLETDAAEPGLDHVSHRDGPQAGFGEPSRTTPCAPHDDARAPPFIAVWRPVPSYRADTP